MRSHDLTLQQLAFVAGLFHDLGKLSLEFVKSKEPSSQTTDYHGQILWKDKESIPKKLWEFLTREWSEIPDISIAKLVCSHHGCQRCLGPADCKGLEDHPVKKILQTYDRCDTSNPADCGKQFVDNMEIETLFGQKTTVIAKSFDNARLELYQTLNRQLESSQSPSELIISWTIEILKATKVAFSETRKHATDLTLGVHLLSTAMLFSLGIDEKPIFCTSVPIHQGHEHGFSIGNDGVEKAIITTQRNMLPDEIIHDSFTPFDEFIWLCDALPNNTPPLPEIIDRCRTAWVKQPEDIEPDYTFEKLINDVEKLKDLAKLSYAVEFEDKKRAWSRHLKNLHKAEALGKLNQDWIEHTRSIESSLVRIDEVLASVGSSKSILEKHHWNDAPEGFEWAWFFLSKTMSPIRPTSPVTWARRILDEDPFDSKESAIKWILGHRLTLGRWLAIKLDQLDDTNLEMFVRDCLQCFF